MLRDATSPRRRRTGWTLALVWFALTFAWAVVVYATDEAAWQLVLWIAVTLGPLAAIRNQIDGTAGHTGIPNRNEGDHR